MNRSSDRTVRLHVTCLNLRHKLMYIDEQHGVPGMVDTRSDTRVYWCTKSQNALGPDGDAVHPDSCSGGRHCYVHGE